jgi:hypothetical protein
MKNNFFIYLLVVYFVITLAGPLALIASDAIDFHSDYRTANRDSAHLAPDPKITKEAIIQVYSARAFNWRGIASVHTWLAIKPKNANAYTVYQVVGWLLFRNLPPVYIVNDIPDRNWFNQKPTLLLDMRGRFVEKIIPKIEKSVMRYPYKKDYITWPGPNSNTFIAWIARDVPEMRLSLPSNAVGKDFLNLSQGEWIARTPSGTGFQVSLYGIVGILLAVDEGIEINLLGLVYGFSLTKMTLKLPGFGDIKLI